MTIGADLVLRGLAELGTRHFFSLPGAASMGLHGELRRHKDIEVTTSLHDTVVVGCADGYARSTKSLGVAHVYEYAGLANASANIYTAMIDESPVLILGTFADQRQSDRGWAAEVGDLPATIQQIVKDAMVIKRADRIPEYLRRAAILAQTPPYGPVYVGIPADFFTEEVNEAVTSAHLPDGLLESLVPAESAIPERVVDSALDLLLKVPETVLVAGSEVVEDGAVELLWRLAEKTGIPVFGEQYARRLPYSDSSLFHGWYDARLGITKAAQGVLAVGTSLGKRFAYIPFPWVYDHQRVVQVSRDERHHGIYPVEAAAVGSPKMLLTALLERLEDESVAADIKGKRESWFKENEPSRARKDPPEKAGFAAEAVFSGISELIGPEDILFDDLIGLRGPCQMQVKLKKAEQYYGTRSGFMGAGPPISLGFAASGKRTILVTGDGTFAMSPQTMWTAANLDAPLVSVVMNNGSWSCLQRYHNYAIGNPASTEELLCNLQSPMTDFAKVAEGFGVNSEIVSDGDQFLTVLKKALDRGGPTLIDARIY